jgi:GT2 family glycosyltransferase
MRHAVIIPTRSGDLLHLCLYAHVLYSPSDIGVVVVDTSKNGLGPEPAVDEAVAMHAQSFAGGLTYLDMRGKDPWYGQAINVGAREAIRQGATHLIIQNDDTVVFPHWNEAFAQDMKAIEREGFPLGILGACSNAISGPQACIGGGLPYGNGPLKGPVHCPRNVTIFALIPAKSFVECGGFDDGLPAHNFSDDALSARMIRKGYSNWASRVFVGHAGSRTLDWKSKGYATDLEAGGLYFRKHYPDYDELLQRGPVKA